MRTAQLSLAVTLAAALTVLPSSMVQSRDGAAAPAPAPVYDPYPVGILPADLAAEIARVRRESRAIFNEALAQWRRMPPPRLQGNPPIIAGSGYQALELLGKLLNFDLDMSPFGNEACSSCHMPYSGFSGPIPSVNLTIVAYPGSQRYRANKRVAQRYTYSPDFPVLEYDETQASFFGGNFFDARATGFRLQSPDAEQAQHPPVDTGEMGFADTACIAYRLSHAGYRPLFVQLWGDSFDIHWPADTRKICHTPGGAAVLDGNPAPIRLSPADRAKTNAIYDHWGESISSYERSPSVSAFSSKFDAFLAGKYTMTPAEMTGYRLFNGKANCNSCHLDGVSTALKPGQTDTGSNNDTRPLFTCFGYANLGLPLNANVALFYETRPDAYGFTPNPYGFGYRDLGLGTFLRGGFGAGPSPNASWARHAPAADGQFQVTTARDVAMTPRQCPTTEAPGPYFQKEFFHNGYIKSLKQLVHFYNTRDVYAYPVTTGHCPPGTVEKVTCWPIREVPDNIDMTLGNLGLTEREEDDLVAFLETLTDGYTSPYPDAGAFTGKCMTGGSAATQGNSSIVPAPVPLPRCAAAICGVSPLPGPHPIPYGRLAALGIRGRYQATRALPAVKRARQLRFVDGPALELARGDFAIIRWTIVNPGGPDDHFAVIHYGLAPDALNRTAQSPIRLNRRHRATTFRVRVPGLDSRTTYYYRVSSADGAGVSDGAVSSVERFTTPAAGQRVETFPQPR